MSTYHTHNGRVYHGASVSLKEFSEGKNPPALVTTQAPPARRPARPVVECYKTPDVGRLVTEMQAARQAGQVPASPPPSRPTTHAALACRTCRKLPCTCGVPRQPTGEDMLALKRERGTF